LKKLILDLSDLFVRTMANGMYCNIINPFILSRPITATKETDIASSSISKYTNVTVVHEMTVYQTSIWIWTFGWNNTWAECKVYSESFFKNEIKGDQLSALTLAMLEKDLGIRNVDHCMAIKNYIDWHFQATNLHQCGVPIVIGPGEESQRSTVSMGEVTTIRSSMSIASASEDNMADSVFNTDESLSECKADSRSLEQTLVLTLRQERRVLVGEKEHVKSIFAKLNYKVQIFEHKVPNKYKLVFEDKEKALEANVALKANVELATLGYTIAKYREPRPSRNNPVMFKTLSPVTVRLGKSLNTKIVAELQKDTIILVNQRKSRRVRVISFQDEDTVKWVSLDGWVSLHSEYGRTFIQRYYQGSHY